MLAALTLAVLIGVAGLTGYLALFEERFIFFPSQTIRMTPGDVGLAFQDRQFVTEDGIVLHGWHIPHPRARYTVLDFHGNAGNIGDRVYRYRRWHDWGVAVFGFDYRGYGRSQGTPSESGLYRDAAAAWRDVTHGLATPAHRVILVGRSLGSGPAVDLAMSVSAGGLVLETPFTSIPDLARVVYPYLPASFLVRTRFDNVSKIARIRVPLMVIHGEDDDIIPMAMGRRLYDTAPQPKVWVSFPGGHNDFEMISDAAYVEAWRSFLASLDR